MYKKIVEINILYDFYGFLLSEKQQRIIEMYYLEDLTLSEIGENLNISRQAVHDTLKRSEKSLYGYEEKLELIGKFNENKECANQIMQKILDLEKSGIDKNEIKELKDLANRLIEINQEVK